MPQSKTLKHRCGWRRLKRTRPDEILAAAAVVFSRKGYAARMSDIAEAAGITKGTIYLYFSGKKVLFETIEHFSVSRKH